MQEHLLNGKPRAEVIAVRGSAEGIWVSLAVPSHCAVSIGIWCISTMPDCSVKCSLGLKT